MKVPAQNICDLLNELNCNDDGFIVGLLARFYVTDELAENSSVMCSKLKGSKHYSSSALGIINALADESVCYCEDINGFMLLSELSDKEQNK